MTNTCKKFNLVLLKIITPCLSSTMSFPTLANVVHLQLLIALSKHLLCTLHLHTSQLYPCDVTPKVYQRHLIIDILKLIAKYYWIYPTTVPDKYYNMLDVHEMLHAKSDSQIENHLNQPQVAKK